jgi:glycosyltransferase involved in cell wall biosynthesis
MVTEYNRSTSSIALVLIRNISLIHSALDFSKIYPVADSRGKNTLVSIARLEKVKNLDARMYACAILKGEEIPFECLIVGDGSERTRLEGMIKGMNLPEEVRLLGYKEQEEVFALLGRAKLLVLTSRSAGWPNVFTEA